MNIYKHMCLIEKIKTCHDKSLSLGFFPTRFITIQTEQPQKMAERLKFRIYEGEIVLSIYVLKTKALMSCTADLRLCFHIHVYA